MTSQTRCNARHGKLDNAHPVSAALSIIELPDFSDFTVCEAVRKIEEIGSPCREPQNSKDIK